MKTTRRSRKNSPKHSRLGQTSWERSVDVFVQAEIAKQNKAAKKAETEKK